MFALIESVLLLRFSISDNFTVPRERLYISFHQDLTCLLIGFLANLRVPLEGCRQIKGMSSEGGSRERLRIIPSAMLLIVVKYSFHPLLRV